MNIKLILRAVGLLFLAGCGVILYTNYIAYDKPTEKPKQDTIISVDTITSDTL
jgi:hypothetical protein